MKTHLKKLIAKGQTEKVIEQLTKLSIGDRTLSNEIIALSGRYHQHQRDRLDKIKSIDYLDVEFNRINQKTLDIIERLPANAKQGSAKNARWLTLSIISVIALIAMTVFFLLPDKVQPNEIESTTETTESTQSTPALTPATQGLRSQTNFDSTNVKTHIEVKDQAKVGTIVTGDSNKIDIKQDF